MDSTEWLTGCAFEWTVHFMQRDKLVWIILLHRVADWVFAGSGGLTERYRTRSHVIGAIYSINRCSRHLRWLSVVVLCSLLGSETAQPSQLAVHDHQKSYQVDWPNDDHHLLNVERTGQSCEWVERENVRFGIDGTTCRTSGDMDWQSHIMLYRGGSLCREGIVKIYKSLSMKSRFGLISIFLWWWIVVASWIWQEQNFIMTSVGDDLLFSRVIFFLCVYFVKGLNLSVPTY